MRFLLDQDLYAVTVRLLRDLGHDTLTASEAGLATVADSELLRAEVEQQRVLVTRDRDFGGKKKGSELFIVAGPCFLWFALLFSAAAVGRMVRSASVSD